MSANVPIGIIHPSTMAVIEDDPVERANSTVEEKHPGIMQKHPEIRERTWGLAARTDPTVTLEEYLHWAVIEREMEMEENRRYIEHRGPLTVKTLIQDRFSSGEKKYGSSQPAAQNEKDVSHVGDASSDEDFTRVTDAEWRQAARALRSAGWGTIFYLVTTDILGWSSAPFVFSSVGWGPGVALFIIFGIAAGFSGWCLWRTYIGLDSARFPMISFGDPFMRLYGPKWRHAINFAQALQQFLSVCVVVLGNSVLLTQAAKGKICYVIVILIIAIVGMISGSIRTLQKIGWICNFSVWMNIANFIVIMYAAGNTGLDWSAVGGQTLYTVNGKKGLPYPAGPIKTFAGPPPGAYQQQLSSGFAAQFNAVSDMVYAYAGALLFVAFMAEMRHPLDFWKGMICAQAFICLVYLLFGAFVYGEWGQYALFSINQAVTPYALQTAGNVLSLLTGWFAVFLYFNIGMKTVYQEVFMEIFHFPSIATTKGKWMWFTLGPIYWALAFVVAAAVPNLSGLVGFIGSVFALNFTYTFPVVLYLAYRVQTGAKLDGEGFDPYTGVTTRHDSGMKRLVRGFTKQWYITIPLTLFILAALTCSGMGAWAAIEGLISIFGPGGTTATNFGCAQPV